MTSPSKESTSLLGRRYTFRLPSHPKAQQTTTHTHTHIYRQHARGRRASALCCCCCCSFSLSLLPRGMGAHHHSEQRERVGWRRKKKKNKKKRDQVIVNTLCLIILVVLLFLLSLSYFPPTSPLFFCVLFFFFFFQYFLGSSRLFCYGPVDKRTNRQTFAGLVVNISLVYKKDPSVSFPLLTSNWKTKNFLSLSCFVFVRGFIFFSHFV